MNYDDWKLADDYEKNDQQCDNCGEDCSDTFCSEWCENEYKHEYFND